VSRRHAKLVRLGDDVYVEDLGSSNGTELNGEPIGGRGRIALTDGDRLGLGSRILELRLGGDDADASPTRRVATLGDLSDLDRPDPTNSRTPTSQINLGGRPNSATWRPTERRKHARRTIELVLRYTSNELEIEASTRDLSQAGVFVNTQVLDPLGTRCQLEIHPPDDGAPPLRIAGIVRHVVERPTEELDVGLGIEFVEVEPDARRWLAMTIAKMAAFD
jgi:FHA domain-containing protein/PilZ domain-containing protein